VAAESASLAVTVAGSGPPVLLLPGLGRCVGDYDQLAASLHRAGFATLAMDHRGHGASTGATDDLTLHDYAADCFAVINEVSGGPAHVVGHMAGQRVARTLAADRPDVVRSLVLLAAGGRVPAGPEATAGLAQTLDPSATEAEHRAGLRSAFFAPGNDPSRWLTGWSREAAAPLALAAVRTPAEDWWLPPPQVPVLVVQGVDDAIALPENGRLLVAEHPDAQLVEIADAGHALLPEQPEAIAEAVVGFLREVEGRS
jgi:pimeloyl-ACP methyl ester carboxylesterase